MRLPIKFLIYATALLSATMSLSVRAQDVLSELSFAFSETEPSTDKAWSGGWRGFLGAGLIALDRPVADRKAFLLPLASISYGDTIYWNVGQLGAWLLKSDDRSARLGIALRARSGYDPDDYEGLVGMNKRDTSAELGLSGKWRTRPMTVSIAYYTDVSDNTNGNSALLGLSFPIRLSDSWTLVPSVGADWLSAEVVNYYYGVRPGEAAPGRPAYSGESSVNLRGAIMAHYKLARAWSLFGGVSVTHLGSGVSDSPIIFMMTWLRFSSAPAGTSEIMRITMKIRILEATKLLRFVLILITAGLAAACGGGSSPVPGTPDTAARIAAAERTATGNAQCQAISPFYYEIGDKSGPIASSSIGGNTYLADTQMYIASASKWLFGAYVAEIRAGVLTTTDVQATRMQSGYVSMGSVCGANMTVGSCFASSSNDTYTPSSLGRFHYNSGHFQKWGVENGMATMSGSQVASEYQAVLGNEIPVTFNGPLLAGGAIMSASGYSIFLRKILNNQLWIASHLGDKKTCTLPGACVTADNSPVSEAWNYSIGHWVEDDPVTGDGAFSSAGAFGFYPWVDSKKQYYGVVARQDLGSGTALSSVECGRKIRKAFVTGVDQ